MTQSIAGRVECPAAILYLFINASLSLASEGWDSQYMKIPLSNVPRICNYTVDMEVVKETLSACDACAYVL